ncbi:four helix bundle protein [bacterium]|nr:four helix bundle protein [bacterium]
MSKSLIKDRSYNFALDVIRLYTYLQSQKEFVISGQLVRSGTSIGANIEEALAGQSKRDFTAKMSIASKEARETNYWLRLLRDSQLVSKEKVEFLIDESKEIISILTSIVKTSSVKKEKLKINRSNHD